MDDQLIIDGFWERPENAINDLSAKYGYLCKTIANRILNNEQDSEECVNDALLAAWNTIPPQNPAPLSAYICKITKNIALNKYHANTAQKRNNYYDAVLGTYVSVAATSSDTFRNWLSKNFFGNKITKVEIPLEENNNVNNDNNTAKADLPADNNSHLELKNNMEVYGTKESFVYQYHTDNEVIIGHVYSIQDNGLKELEIKTFTGKYDGTVFSFEYAVINNEILGFNLNGSINGVFHYYDNGIVYANLDITDNNTILKGCIAMLDLDTGSVTKLTDDNTIGNMLMSPQWKTNIN